MKKNLTEILFDTMESVSSAKTKEAVEMEVNKAHSIINVSKQVIEVGRLKLDIAREGGVSTEFPEISEDKRLLTLGAGDKNGKAKNG